MTAKNAGGIRAGPAVGKVGALGHLLVANTASVHAVRRLSGAVSSAAGPSAVAFRTGGAMVSAAAAAVSLVTLTDGIVFAVGSATAAAVGRGFSAVVVITAALGGVVAATLIIGAFFISVTIPTLVTAATPTEGAGVRARAGRRRLLGLLVVGGGGAD